MRDNETIAGLCTPAMPQGLFLLPREPPACSLVILQPSDDTAFLHSCIAAKNRQIGGSGAFTYFSRSEQKHCQY